mgnify:CR=1 FL=1
MVILTRNMGYRKKKPGKSTPLYVAAFRHYPEFLTLYIIVTAATTGLWSFWKMGEGRTYFCHPPGIPLWACGSEQREADGVLSAWL